MDVSQAYYIVNTLLKDKANIPEIGKEEMNDLFSISNDLFLAKKMMQKKSEANQQGIRLEDYLAVDEDFRPLKLTEPIALSSGSGTLPTDYVKYLAAYGTLSSVVRDVEIIGEKELNERRFNVFSLLEYHPACNIKGSTVFVLPTNVSDFNLTYIKQPSTPVYADSYNSTSGLNEYAVGSSTQFDWDEHNHPDIIIEILGLLGVSATYQDVKKYLQK